MVAKKRYLFLLAVLLAFYDQVTKFFIVNFLGSKSLDFGFFSIIQVTNKGAGFGFFQDFNFILTIFSLFVFVVALYYYFRLRNWKLLVLLNIFIGGLAGNLIDRFRYGYVVDFINLKIWPVFNVADTAITISILMMIYLLYRKE